MDETQQNVLITIQNPGVFDWVIKKKIFTVVFKFEDAVTHEPLVERRTKLEFSLKSATTETEIRDCLASCDPDEYSSQITDKTGFRKCKFVIRELSKIYDQKGFIIDFSSADSQTVTRTSPFKVTSRKKRSIGKVASQTEDQSLRDEIESLKKRVKVLEDSLNIST